MKVCIVISILCIEYIVIRLKLVDLIGREIVELAIFGISPEVLLAQYCFTGLSLLLLLSLNCNYAAFLYLLKIKCIVGIALIGNLFFIYTLTSSKKWTLYTFHIIT